MTPQAAGRPAGWAIALGSLILVASTAAVTIAIERRTHGDSAHEPEKKEGDASKEGESEPGVLRVKLTSAQEENAGIEFATARPGRVDESLSLPGEVAINGDALAHVTPRIGGAVRQVSKKLGDAVKKGDVLAVLESRELAELERDVRATNERFSLAQSSFDRIDKLYADKVVSEKEYLVAKSALAEARIDRDSANLRLAASGPGSSGNAYSLFAPFDGTIIEKHVTVGEVLRDDTRVFVIADLSTVWVDLTVFARDLPRVEVGQRVRVRAQGIDAPALGVIGYLGPVASEATRSARARVVLDHPAAGFRPGLFVTGDVTLAEAEARVVVPDEAVETIHGKTFIFVEEDEGTFVGKPVVVGRDGLGDSGEAMVELVSGLPEGAKFVRKGAQALKAEIGKREGGEED